MAFSLFKTIEQDLLINTDDKTISVIPELATKDYAKVKSILNRLGGVWRKSQQVFEFKKCPKALIDRVLTLGSRQINKFQFYPTPAEVFQYITEYTPLSYIGASGKTIRVLEPSAGEGSLVRQLMDFGRQEERDFVIDGYDIDPLNVIFCQEAGLNISQADFLNTEPKADYDLVLMNPPFSGDVFIKHLRHAQRYLKSDGILISVVPTEWILDHKSRKNRSWLFEQAQLDSIEDMNPGNFFEPGTFKGVSISTTVICLRSEEAAKKTLNSDEFKVSAVETFDAWISNCGAMEEHSNKLIADIEQRPSEIIDSVGALVSNILKVRDSDTIHLYDRFEADYINLLVEKWFPDHAKVLKPSSDPQQLDLISLFDSGRAA
ncbi:hypothetical protein [Microbulbifer epialgicus]|uniref:Methyltransferase small domain-containing protein n=1 Tax=Microbulbifer epialgicus TaxID=393907 RepID=A0ABV4NU83_9GAMM